MKKLFISIVLALPFFASCLIDDADVNYIDAGDLTRYAKDRIAETIALPAEAMEIALALDDYMKETDPQKAAENVLHGKIETVSQDNYVIRIVSDKEYRDTYFEIYTNGVSIRDKGAEWNVRQFTMYGNDFAYSNLDYHFSLPESARLVAVAPEEGYWGVESSKSRILMVLSSVDNGRYSWRVSVAESEDTQIGVKAYYGTQGMFTLTESLLASGEKTNLYSGKFFVEIYRNDETLIDYCYADFNGTSDSKYTTSR